MRVGGDRRGFDVLARGAGASVGDVVLDRPVQNQGLLQQNTDGVAQGS